MTCRNCTGSIPKHPRRRGRRAKYCSDACALRQLDSMTLKSCGTFGSCAVCNKPTPERSKGQRGRLRITCSSLCKLEYKREYHALYDSQPAQIERRKAAQRAKTKG